MALKYALKCSRELKKSHHVKNTSSHALEPLAMVCYLQAIFP
jgi:hypothetical protein